MRRLLFPKGEAVGRQAERYNSTGLSKEYNQGVRQSLACPSGLVQLKKLLEKADLPEIRFHDLRHSTATLLLSEGVHPKVVQEILGHSEITDLCIEI